MAKKTFKTVEDSVEIYPRGRGKVTVITKKSILPKEKFEKNKNRFNHSYVQMNPSRLTLTEFINNDGRKRIYLFPPNHIGKQLDYEERLELCSSLAITLLKDGNKHLISNELRKRIKFKLNRYKKWRDKHE